MSSPDTDPEDVQAEDVQAEDVQAEDVQAESDGEEKQPLSLEVKIDKPGTCERHVTVSVARADVDRYIKEAFDELKPKAEVPGFRPGPRPRKLVESRFKDQIGDQVKGSLVSDALAQVSEDYEFSAISEPEFDFNAVSLPDDGPFSFEFDVEVRPEFDAPNWKGLSLEQPVRVYTDVDIDQQTTKLLERHGKMVERDGAAELHDILEVDIRVTHEGKLLSEQKAVLARVESTLSFPDSEIKDFDKLTVGVASGETRETTAVISDGATNESMRGKEVDVNFAVSTVQRIELPKLTPAFLDSIGGFEDEDELREAVRDELNRQLTYYEQKQLREQISSVLTKDADWELPPDLLRRQAKRELERAVLELQSSGFSDAMIQKHANQIRQNSLASTERAIKEHFIFERIAEDEKIDAEPNDYEDEVRLIAERAEESPRRVRARLEKRGQMDALRNQIVERKVIGLICQNADITEVPLEEKSDDVFAMRTPLVGGHDASAIPEAKHGGDAEEIRDRPDRH